MKTKATTGCILLACRSLRRQDDLKVAYTKSKVVQSNNYYPFGLQTSNSWTRIDTKPNQYLYNAGSELNDATGSYEMAYRGYDPAIGRMSGVDPLAARYAHLTPYQYAANDPVYYNDPTGAMTDDTPWSVEYKRRGKYKYTDSPAEWAAYSYSDFGGGFNTYQNFYGSGWHNQMNNGSSFTGYGVTTAMSDAYVNAILQEKQGAKSGNAQALQSYGARHGTSLGLLPGYVEVGGIRVDKSSWEVVQQTGGGPGDPSIKWFGTWEDISSPEYPGVKIYETSLMREYSGVTLPGIGILIHPSVRGVSRTKMLQHEYGHFLDSQYFKGARFYTEIGIPSIWNTISDPSSHDSYWTEIRANKRAERFFGENYIPDPINYPTKYYPK
ncbi:MAG: hypothetical protein KF717_13235 [Cyclobacteriaceae bacterium]|nr:hypothetical protein [Cyclobacteriaceae bacterium]MCB9236368.1 hypothetical protein [Flammeovirgaceae bacterium]